MPYTTFSVRMDSDVKKQFDNFCSEVGMNTTTAFNLFARAVLRENRLPFEVAVNPDPFYSASNQKRLAESLDELNQGKGIMKTLEELKEYTLE
jgi:DNA-damage-inducible protein J